MLENKLQEAAIAYVLVAGDPRHDATVPDSLRSPAGGLLDPATIMNDPMLEKSFKDWLTANNDKVDDGSTYDAVVESATRFRGGFQTVKNQFGLV